MSKLLKKITTGALASLLVLSSGFNNTKVQAQTNTDIDSLLKGMTQEEKFGQLIMPDFRHWTVDGKQVPFVTMNEEVGKVISDYKLGGIILFRENVANTEQTARLTDGLQKAVSNDIPLMITIDQEGGLVTRLQTGTNMPGNMAMGATRDAALTREVAKAMGEEVRSLGININFAPTVDVNSNYLNPVIGIRSFGSNADLVAEMGVAYIKGLQDARVAGAAKHFPGHGDTATDSHFGLPVVDKSLEELKKVDLKPFRAAIESGVDMLMTAHIVVPALDDAKILAKDGTMMGTPATLSKPILTDLVRDELKYDGIVITDALNMKAISDNFTEAEAVVKTLAAGSDIALMPTFIRTPSDVAKLDAIYDALDKAIEDGTLSQDKIDKSVHRVLTLKKNREILDSKDSRTIDEKVADAKLVVGSASHKEIERRAAEKAITLIKNEDNVLPFNLTHDKSVLILSSYKTRANLMELQLNNIIKSNSLQNIAISRFVFTPGASLTPADKERIDNADFIVMESMNLSKSSKYAPEVVTYANEISANLAVMSTRNPYDIMFMENVKANIAVYGASGYDQTQEGEAALPINIPVGMDVIFGHVKPTGKLPVEIPKLDGSGILYEYGHGLTYREAAVTSDLVNIIDVAESLDEADYTKESYEVMLTSVNYGKELLEMYAEDKWSVTQAQFDAAVESINSAIAELEDAKTPATTMELEAAIEKAKELKEEKYTPASYMELTKALTEGETILMMLTEDKWSVTQEEVDNAVEAINKALAQLEEQVVLASTKALEDMIKDANEIDKSKYTTQSYSELTKAVNAGELLLEKFATNPASVTQEETDKAALELKNAMTKLEKIKPVVKPDKPEAEKPSKDDKLPSAGAAPTAMLSLLGLAFISGGSAYMVHNRKSKK